MVRHPAAASRSSSCVFVRRHLVSLILEGAVVITIFFSFVIVIMQKPTTSYGSNDDTANAAEGVATAVHASPSDDAAAAVRLRLTSDLGFESCCPPEVTPVMSPSMFTEIIDSINAKIRPSSAENWPHLMPPMLAILVGVLIATSWPIARHGHAVEDDMAASGSDSTSPSARNQEHASNVDVQVVEQEEGLGSAGDVPHYDSADRLRRVIGASIGIFGIFISGAIGSYISAHQISKRFDNVRVYLKEVNQHNQGRLIFSLFEKKSIYGRRGLAFRQYNMSFMVMPKAPGTEHSSTSSLVHSAESH